MTGQFCFGELLLAPFDLAGAATWIVAQAHQRRASVVVTSNIHHLRLARIDPAFREAISRAELNIADGWPLVAASRILPGARLPARVPGVDLVEAVLRSASCLRIAVLGGSPGGAREFARRLKRPHEAVIVDALPLGCWEDEASVAALCARLEAAHPDLTLIAVGAPRQEELADVLQRYVRGPIICCGAAVDILAGVRPRAPRWLQSMGLEWAFRLALEPARLGPRYALSGVCFVRILGRALVDSLTRSWRSS